jgi:hypothetical protein
MSGTPATLFPRGAEYLDARELRARMAVCNDPVAHRELWQARCDVGAARDACARFYDGVYLGVVFTLAEDLP